MKNDDKEKSEKINIELSEEEKEILNMYRELSKNEKTIIQRL